MSTHPSASVALLYRRAGFGASASQIAALSAQPYSTTVDQLVGPLGGPDPGADTIPVPPLSPPPTNYAQLKNDATARQALARTLAVQRVALTNWWLGRMVSTTNPLQEKLTFLLHGHFPTAISKVRFPIYMYGQNQLFRTKGSGDFDALTQAVATDPAMLIWLDAASDIGSSPNENFARELMERFTMGIGNYTEDDVRAGAACFSGWRLSRVTNAFTIDAKQHNNSPQTFLGNQINSGQQAIDLVTHSSASAKFVPAALWSHLAYPVTTQDPVVADLSPGYAADRNVANLLRAIFQHPSFVSDASITGLIKQPTEYVVGALRALGVKAASLGTLPVQATLAGLGQVLFNPPSVGGWDQNEYWLSTAAALTRWDFAHRLATTADISSVADQPAAARVDATAALLSLTGWSTTTAAALQPAAGNPETLVTLGLVSPEYVSN